MVTPITTETIPDWLKMNTTQDNTTAPAMISTLQVPSENISDARIEPILIDTTDDTRAPSGVEDTIPDWIKNTPAINTDAGTHDLGSTDAGKENKITPTVTQEGLPDWLINSLQTDESPVTISGDIPTDIPTLIVGELSESESVVEQPVKKVVKKTKTAPVKKEEKKS